MENKIQSIIGGRVALSGCCEGHIETATNQNYFAYIVVSIQRRWSSVAEGDLSRPAAYSTNGVPYETN